MEQWKPVEGYEGLYEVSDMGRIKSIIYNNHIIMKYHSNWFWYMILSLRKEWKSLTEKVHRIVCNSFLHNPENKEQVNHINWIKHDNRLENLEWCDRSYNQKHAYKTGLRKVTENNNLIKNNPSKWKFWKDSALSVSVIQSDENSVFIKEWGSIIDASRGLWINKSSISMCCNWKRNFAWKYKWRYKQ